MYELLPFELCHEIVSDLLVGIFQNIFMKLYINEPQHEISKGYVRTAKPQIRHTRSLIRAFASRLDIL